jgi:hypothetical protein
MRGYMRGKQEYNAQQVMKNKAKTDNLRNSYNQDAALLYQMAQSGADPKSPEYQQAVSAVQGSWGALNDWIGQHVDQDDGKKKKSSKSKSGNQQQQPVQDPLADLKSPDPNTRARALYQLQKKMGPPVLWQVKQLQSPEAKQTRANQATATKLEGVKGENELTVEEATRERDQILKGEWHPPAEKTAQPTPAPQPQGQPTVHPQGQSASAVSPVPQATTGATPAPQPPTTGATPAPQPAVPTTPLTVAPLAAAAPKAAATSATEGEKFITQSLRGKPSIPGMVFPGNINVEDRPNIANPDGSHSSAFSMSSEIDGKEVLYPGVGDGTTYPARKLTPKEALDQYRKTKKMFGVFKDAPSANAYARFLHQDQEKYGNKPAGETVSGAAEAQKPPVQPEADWDSNDYRAHGLPVPAHVERLEVLNRVLAAHGKAGDELKGAKDEIARQIQEHPDQPLTSSQMAILGRNVPTVKTAKPTWKGNSLVDVVDSSGKAWTPEQIEAGGGGEDVRGIYKAALKTQDDERKAAKEKDERWYAHANYSDALQTRRIIKTLGLRIDASETAANIKEWAKWNDKANTAEQVYQEAASVKKPTSTSDQKLLIEWVRSNNPSSSRLPDSEIKRAIAAGGYGLKAKNAFSMAADGTMTPELHKDFLGDIRNAAQSNREKAEELKEGIPGGEDTLRAISDAQAGGGGKTSGAKPAAGAGGGAVPKGWD